MRSGCYRSSYISTSETTFILSQNMIIPSHFLGNLIDHAVVCDETLNDHAVVCHETLIDHAVVYAEHLNDHVHICWQNGNDHEEVFHEHTDM